MKLLIVTQVVDIKDPILGFFVRWIEEFSKHTERVEVICLKEGKHNLPANVRVHSLGKEKGVSRAIYVLNFYRYIWRLRRDYDAVFVHMNPEYIMLGGCLWRLWGKRITLWYNHPHAGLRFFLAAHFSHQLLFTSWYSASARFAHVRQMPVGIDTELFTPQPVARDRNALYMQGRVMRSKRVHIALEALRLLRIEIPATLTIVGPEESEYTNELRKKFTDLISSGVVSFKGPVPNTETSALYSAHGISINLAAPGHFDKSVLESMACGTPVVACSDVAFQAWRVKQDDPQDLASALLRLITLPEVKYTVLQEESRAHVVEKHSLAKLSKQLTHVLQ
jgi:glycosyltransferase involved in cell wall biosynthesis